MPNGDIPMQQQGSCAIRPIVIDDADCVAAMAREFTGYLQGLGDTVTYRLTADRIRRDGFGPDPAFGGFIAERGGAVLGYLLHHPGYNSVRAERYLVVCDLFVREGERRSGAGRALMAAAMDHGRVTGARGLFWSVYKPNKTAIAFYRRLGAKTVEYLDFMWWPADA